MTIRPLAFSDLRALARLKAPWRLSVDWELTQPPGVRMLSWRSLFPQEMSGACTLVDHDGALQAQVQAEARPGRDKWTLMRAALAPDADPARLVPLLEALIVCAGQHGAGRLFAVADDAAAVALRRAGFTAYADETIYHLTCGETREEVISRPPTPYAIRPQRSRDVWGVHTLYAAVTPRPVQLMEGLISDDWEYPLHPWLAGLSGQSETRLVLEAEAGVCGFASLVRGQKGHRVEVMVHPRYRRLTAPFLQAALEVAARWPQRPLYCPVRGYQSELGAALESVGFAPLVSQTLMVREMAVRVRQRLRIFEPATKPAMEPVRMEKG
jgi:hypothetical protein